MNTKTLYLMEVDALEKRLKQLRSFPDTLLEQEQPKVDLKKELDQWRHKHFKGKRDDDYSGEYLERENQLDLARHFYSLDKQSSENSGKLPKIKGWVARDTGATHLSLYFSKPVRINDVFHNQEGTSLPFNIPLSCFPNLKHEDEPIEVELTIKPVKK